MYVSQLLQFHIRRRLLLPELGINMSYTEYTLYSHRYAKAKQWNSTKELSLGGSMRFAIRLGCRRRNTIPARIAQSIATRANTFCQSRAAEAIPGQGPQDMSGKAKKYQQGLGGKHCQIDPVTGGRSEWCLACFFNR